MKQWAKGLRCGVCCAGLLVWVGACSESESGADSDADDSAATDVAATDTNAEDTDASETESSEAEDTDPEDADTAGASMSAESDVPGPADTDEPAGSETDTTPPEESPDDSTESPDAPPMPAGELDACGNAAGQVFPPGAAWNTPIAGAPLDAESDAIIGYLAANHDTGTRFQIDFSFRVLSADDSVEHRAFEPTGDFYAGECDPAPMPVPEGGSLEGEEGYACESDGDCHLIVLDSAECRLFEMWRADIRGEQFNGGCMAVWEVDRVYGPEGRGDFCTSADAAGLPIAPLLFTADEVYAGHVNHAVRFILPNQHIRENIYVRPGTHSTGATSGPDDAPPYSSRLRLKADTAIAGLSPGAQVVARGLMEYGMILADGGNLTFTGLSDRDTEHSWAEAELTPQDLKGLEWTDFEVVELGERIDYGSGDCQRQAVTE